MTPFGDPPPERSPETKNEWGILVILSFFFGLFLVLELARDFTPAKLSVPFFLVSWAVLLVAHELGHAAMARMLGMRVTLISLGFGRVRARAIWFGIPVEFRTVPLSGFVLPKHRDLIAPRLKQFLVFAAGPGIELLLVAVLAGVFGTDNLLQRTPDAGIIAVQSFCVAGLLGIVLNLLPIPHQTESGTAWSDGLGMILCWRLPEEWFREQLEK